MSGKSTLRVAGWAAALVVAFALGFVFRGGDSGSATDHADAHAHDEAEIWTCSMHPQVRMPEAGRCPICGMDLIPLTTASADPADDRVLEVDAASLRLARVRTEPVRREAVEIDVPMVGKVDVDETRLRDITAYVPGRIERMYVDYTGVAVRRGDHLVDLYSPELVAAQEELIQSVRSAERLEGNPLESLSQTAQRTVVAAREKLRLLGMNPSQIDKLESTRERRETITFYSPIEGVVLRKHANQGAYVQTGSPLYTLASLDRLWIRLDAYESDLEWLRLGQSVRFEADAFPGETFEGRITFIDPLVDPVTRTTHVRLNVRNPDGRLKPGMLVRARARGLAAGGHRVFDPYLANKWISPMHPEIVKDGPGSCDVCGMPLVPARELGFADTAVGEAAPLTIPASAPLITGDRAVVYVEADGGKDAPPRYASREIVLGPRAGDRYLVMEGLEEGERVVVEGAFRLDAAMQIQAKPSMMSADDATDVRADARDARDTRDARADARRHGGAAGTPRTPAAADPEPTARWLGPYLDLQEALAGDAFDEARAVLESWPDGERSSVILAMREAEDLDGVRSSFEALSEAILAAAPEWPASAKTQVAFCPMAGDGGARWLQRDGPLANPYYGASMLRCGVLRGAPGEAEGDDADAR